VTSLQDRPSIFIGLLVLGFLVGMFGHVYKSNFAIGIGIAMVFSATVVIPGLVYFSD
jgi:ABC-type phosphate transport system permease subunit